MESDSTRTKRARLRLLGGCALLLLSLLLFQTDFSNATRSALRLGKSSRQLSATTDEQCLELLRQLVEHPQKMGTVVIHAGTLLDELHPCKGKAHPPHTVYSMKAHEASTMCQPNVLVLSMLFSNFDRKDINTKNFDREKHEERHSNNGPRLVDAIRDNLNNRDSPGGLFSISVPSFVPNYMEGHGYGVIISKNSQGHKEMRLIQAFHHLYSMHNWANQDGLFAGCKKEYGFPTYTGFQPLDSKKYLEDLEQYMSILTTKKWPVIADELHWNLHGSRFLPQGYSEIDLVFDTPDFPMGYSWSFYPINEDLCREAFSTYNQHLSKPQFEDTHGHVVEEPGAPFHMVHRYGPVPDDMPGRKSHGRTHFRTEHNSQVQSQDQLDTEGDSATVDIKHLYVTMHLKMQNGERLKTWIYRDCQGKEPCLQPQPRTVEVWNNGFIYFYLTHPMSEQCCLYYDFCMGSVNAINHKKEPELIKLSKNRQDGITQCLVVSASKEDLYLCSKYDQDGEDPSLMQIKSAVKRATNQQPPPADSHQSSRAPGLFLLQLMTRSQSETAMRQRAEMCGPAPL